MKHLVVVYYVKIKKLGVFVIIVNAQNVFGIELLVFLTEKEKASVILNLDTKNQQPLNIGVKEIGYTLNQERKIGKILVIK